MASLKAIKIHAVAVGNIQKITNTIKMVATSKFIIAQKELRKIRVFGEGTKRFYNSAKIKYDPKIGVRAAVTGDRGLCGGLHTKICKQVRIDQHAEPGEGGIVCIGEKAKSLLAMTMKNQFRLVVNGVGHRSPTFKQASAIAPRIFGDFPLATLTYPFFENIMTFSVISSPMLTSSWFGKHRLIIDKYEQEEDNDLEFYLQFSYTSLLYYAMSECYVSELAHRITSMSSSSKNAGKIRRTLMQHFNRLRQAKITLEIVDIVSGVETTTKKKKGSRKLKFLMDDGGGDGSSKDNLLETIMESENEPSSKPCANPKDEEPECEF